uniref:Uncharacterized protein n=1 Tax=Heterosigma akashiwo TaxID=2829 RepID=A0A6V1UZT4_HETAK|mmetsp:Transcript_53479/g.78093  ORF Transcript_53479/g.78093 Transcript_53479/m.78093 type:complete len:188 (+) Transcript_53479:78-641(+)|eukprot:CAMPEP_0194585326 /NCGR_PEP_ID=MMETSP0292-20121207/17692_1 /TAXON_ID=39354 /ORGANISM="Heterosigma akashiwo, Strain CCMP2393" /LENGTH=187 /DNA_ID=CAMNT_0039440765 /DNA_START=67 /DNA_END=630 /DNA_ORIENTATION=-
MTKAKDQKTAPNWENDDSDEAPEAISTKSAREQALQTRGLERKSITQVSQKRKKRKRMNKEVKIDDVGDDEEESDLLPDQFLEQVVNEKKKTIENHRQKEMQQVNFSEDERENSKEKVNRKKVLLLKRQDNFIPIPIQQVGKQKYEVVQTAKSFLDSALSKRGQRINYQAFVSKKGERPSLLFKKRN